jgi:DNA-binding IclR family transcriptional regulator
MRSKAGLTYSIGLSGPSQRADDDAVAGRVQRALAQAQRSVSASTS